MFFFYNRMLNIAAFLVLLCAIVSPSFGQDLYEVDDTYAKATIIVVNAKDNASQHHTIHQADDTDWIKFYALEGKDYYIFAFNQTPEMNGYIELYETDGETLIIRINTGGANHPENFDRLNWYCTVEGIYYAKIGLAWPEDYADGSEYDLQVYDPNLFSLPGYLTGMVLSTAGKAISGAVIKLTGSEDMGSGISLGDGSFLAAVKEGSYTIDVTANGYQSAARSGVAVPGSVNFALNTVPVALADQVETIRGGTVTDNVLDNDFDEDGDTLTSVLDSGVVHGTLSLNRNGQFVYTHNGGNAKKDSFTYHANDGRANSSPVQVTIAIDQVPFTFLMLLMKEKKPVP